jgi:hypothetical protein
MPDRRGDGGGLHRGGCGEALKGPSRFRLRRIRAPALPGRAPHMVGVRSRQSSAVARWRALGGTLPKKRGAVATTLRDRGPSPDSGPLIVIRQSDASRKVGATPIGNSLGASLSQRGTATLPAGARGESTAGPLIDSSLQSEVPARAPCGRGSRSRAWHHSRAHAPQSPHRSPRYGYLAVRERP